MPDLPDDLLTRPAEEAARLVALEHLQAAAAALERCLRPDYTEGLHDFRVALRRLRSVVRAYRSELSGGAPKAVRRRLRQLTAGTNAGRDAEVFLDWLRVQYEGLTPRERVGWRWLVARVEARQREAAEALDDLAVRFTQVEHRLRRRLASYRLTVELNGEGTTAARQFGAATADVLRGLSADLASRLVDAPAATDTAAVHAARISAKRLRYLLEPVADPIGGDGAVERLRALQDLLGELNDAHVASRELASAVEAAGAERARRLFDGAVADSAGPAKLARRRDELPGLVALAHLARRRWDRGFAQLEVEWLGTRAAPFFQEVARLAEALLEPRTSRPTGVFEPAAGGGRWSAAGRAARRSPRARPGV